MIFDRIFLLFLLAGLINTIIGVGIMFLMYNVFNFGYWFSSAANYVIGSVLSFFLNKYWTFNVRKWSLFMIIAFITTIIISYFFAYKIAKAAIYFLLVDYSIKIRDNTALAAGMCLFTGLNYIGQRFFVFQKQRNS
jgi:putative flippase GtrA